MLWRKFREISLFCRMKEISPKIKKRPYVPVAYFPRWQLCDNNDVLDMWRRLTLCSDVKSRSVASKTLFDVAFCHMAVFSCCDVGTIVIEEAPNLHKQTPAGLQSHHYVLGTPASGSESDNFQLELQRLFLDACCWVPSVFWESSTIRRCQNPS